MRSVPVPRRGCSGRRSAPGSRHCGRRLISLRIATAAQGEFVNPARRVAHEVPSAVSPGRRNRGNDRHLANTSSPTKVGSCPVEDPDQFGPSRKADQRPRTLRYVPRSPRASRPHANTRPHRPTCRPPVAKARCVGKLVLPQLAFRTVRPLVKNLSDRADLLSEGTCVFRVLHLHPNRRFEVRDELCDQITAGCINRHGVE